jgi:putative addiction module component (TIGR02574 family)
MTMTVAELLAEAMQLPVEDRKLIVQELQDSLSTDDECFSLSPEWLAEIQRRIADSDAHPERSIPWEQVHKEALARIAAHVAK